MLAALGLLSWAGAAQAESPETTHRLGLREAAEHALERHGAAVVASGREAVAAARVEVVRAEASPRVGLAGQVNRSTGNVVPGALFAMPGVPPIAGPPGATRGGLGVWQSAVGLTASWDVMEIVRRPVLVGAAEAEVATARAQTGLTRLQIVERTLDAYLRVAEAKALERAAEASEKRTQTYRAVVATLVEQKLRPEIDLSRVETELSAARVATEKGRLGVVVARLRLAEAIGEADWSVEIVDAELAGSPSLPAGAGPRLHPALAAPASAAKAAEARAAAARLGQLPRLELTGAAWLRGGDYVLGGPNTGLGAGLIPDTPNWALGLVALWAPTDLGAVQARVSAETAEAGLQRARAQEISDALTTEKKVAQAAFTSAVSLASGTLAAVSSARRTLDLAQARYAQALGNVLEVAEAERALAVAEREEAVSRLDAWRALVALQRAQGDLGPLLGGGRKAER
jgi:outer membrane protein TolC